MDTVLRSENAEENFWSFFTDVIKAKFSSAKVCFKDESMLMRFIGWIFRPFNPVFMTRYTTVLGTTIYFPSQKWLKENYYNAIDTLAHEYVHMVDRASERKYAFELKYLMPQIVSIFGFFSILAVVNLWFLLFLLFFGFLFPWPSPWRTRYEANAYVMSMHFIDKTTSWNYDRKSHAGAIAEMFTRMGYWRMSWSRQRVVDMLLTLYDKLVPTHPAFIEVDKWLLSKSSSPSPQPK